MAEWKPFDSQIVSAIFGPNPDRARTSEEACDAVLDLLAAHDAEVRAQALKDAADAMYAIFRSGQTLGTASDLWLRARAERGEA